VRRDYLAGRGLTPQALEQWEMDLRRISGRDFGMHLKGTECRGRADHGAGLANLRPKAGVPMIRFRGRINLPYFAMRGRAIAFGGRAMDPMTIAKYLNSPETELFDKGRSLYNVRDARTAAGQGKPLIVAEGVYGRDCAGARPDLVAAVAPWERQITEASWQMCGASRPEPIITLDGDTAGQRAAMR